MVGWRYIYCACLRKRWRLITQTLQSDSYGFALFYAKRNDSDFISDPHTLPFPSTVPRLSAHRCLSTFLMFPTNILFGYVIHSYQIGWLVHVGNKGKILCEQYRQNIVIVTARLVSSPICSIADGRGRTSTQGCVSACMYASTWSRFVCLAILLSVVSHFNVMCHWQPFNSPSMIATRDIRDIEGGHITSPLPTKCIICTRRLTPFLCCCTCTFALCILLVDSRWAAVYCCRMRCRI